jgi:hypothetical protein
VLSQNASGGQQTSLRYYPLAIQCRTWYPPRQTYFCTHWFLPCYAAWYILFASSTLKISHTDQDVQLSHLVCHYRAPASIPAFLATLLLPPAALSYVVPSTSPVLGFFQHLALYWISLGTSIAFYRLSPFHPLAKIPGPALAKVSRLWAARHVMAGRQHVLSHELFEHYHSDIIRTGPNHVIIRDARAVPVLLGGRDRWLKHAREYRLLGFV